MIKTYQTYYLELFQLLFFSYSLSVSLFYLVLSVFSITSLLSFLFLFLFAFLSICEKEFCSNIAVQWCNETFHLLID